MCLQHERCSLEPSLILYQFGCIIYWPCCMDITQYASQKWKKDPMHGWWTSAVRHTSFTSTSTGCMPPLLLLPGVLASRRSTVLATISLAVSISRGSWDILVACAIIEAASVSTLSTISASVTWTTGCSNSSFACIEKKGPLWLWFSWQWMCGTIFLMSDMAWFSQNVILAGAHIASFRHLRVAIPAQIPTIILTDTDRGWTNSQYITGLMCSRLPLFSKPQETDAVVLWAAVGQWRPHTPSNSASHPADEITVNLRKLLPTSKAIVSHQ